ncbi:PilZ domain-containing protein [uncultured Treponema sp.]|uniref:PilZ domain-containing protein n=1 Tax=uncultured Treponema sp. TaxID=162155 RepID=UPI0025D96AE9|nr:PilZ domain-containing protein [uncultured Treponema sp.]
MFPLQTGSPLQARLDVNIFSVILILLLIIFIITVIFVISKLATNYVRSPAYIEKKKNRPTSLKDINEIAALCSLTKEEKEVLAQMCKMYRTPNIKYLVRDYQSIQECLKAQFRVFDKNQDEIGKTYLFAMRRKLFKVFCQQGLIKNSKNISAGTIFTYTVAKGFHHKLTLVENNPDAMILNLPPVLKQEELPKQLEKVNFIFEMEDGTPYNIETRVVRYQIGKENENQIVVVHSDKVSALQKREQERAELNLSCKFHSVKTVVEGSGKKEKISYIPSEKAHDGVLEDISAGGCRLIATLPIKAEQNIFIEGQFNMKDNDHAIGTIVRTTKRSDGIYILHIKFIKIDVKVVNRIQAMVCKYDD